MELRAARERSGKTQAQVAREARISEVAYQQYEYDKREPRVRTAIRIADALDVADLRELFGEVRDDGNYRERELGAGGVVCDPEPDGSEAAGHHGEAGSGG